LLCLTAEEASVKERYYKKEGLEDFPEDQNEAI